MQILTIIGAVAQGVAITAIIAVLVFNLKSIRREL